MKENNITNLVHSAIADYIADNDDGCNAGVGNDGGGYNDDDAE